METHILKKGKMTAKCRVCEKEFRTFPSNVKRGQGKHCSYKCRSKSHSKKLGANSNNWKGGKTIDARGYVLVRASSHPFAKKNHYVQEHRLVMEKHLNRFLRPQEVVHHINGILTDNRIENLVLFSSQKDHVKEEMRNGIYIGTHEHQKRNQQGVFI